MVVRGDRRVKINVLLYKFKNGIFSIDITICIYLIYIYLILNFYMNVFASVIFFLFD